MPKISNEKSNCKNVMDFCKYVHGVWIKVSHKYFAITTISLQANAAYTVLKKSPSQNLGEFYIQIRLFSTQVYNITGINTNNVNVTFNWSNWALLYTDAFTTLIKISTNDAFVKINPFLNQPLLQLVIVTHQNFVNYHINY